MCFVELIVLNHMVKSRIYLFTFIILRSMSWRGRCCRCHIQLFHFHLHQSVKHRSLKHILPKGPLTFLKRLKVTVAIKVIATLKYEMLELQECHVFELLRLCCHEECGVILCSVF